MSQELLAILRCPSCVRDGPEAGHLDRAGNWLVCGDCDRKYPIRDDIPVMLIEEGDRFQGVPLDELPEVPPPEVARPAAEATFAPGGLDDQQMLLLAVAGMALGLGLIVLLVLWARKKNSE